MKYFSLLIIFFLLSCINQNSEEGFEEIDITFIKPDSNISNNENPTWKYQIDKILDSLKGIDTSSKEAYHFVINNFFDTNQYYFEPQYLNIDFFTKMIQIGKLNDYIIVQLKHPHGSKLENNIEVIILNNKRTVLSRDTLLGNRYWIGNIKVTDWNNDGKDELVYKYDDPVSSVAIMSKYEEVYLFSKETSKLNQIFRLETEEFNCGPGDSSLIARNYIFEGKYKIKVEQKKYIVDCNTDGEKELQKRLVSKKLYHLIWDKKENKYIEKRVAKSMN